MRVLGKDLFELLNGFRGIALVLVLPSLLLLLVGQLNMQSSQFRLLVAGAPPDHEILRLLQEISTLEVTTQEKAIFDPLTAMNNDHFDLLLNVQDTDTEHWVLYTAETDPSRLASLQQMAIVIGQALKLIREKSYEVEELVTVGIFPPARSLFIYYPQATEHSLTLLPMAIALIVCFLPSIIAAPSLIREKEAHTLEILLVAPGIGPGPLFAGKCLLPLTVSLLNFFLMLVLAQSVYALHVKSGLFRITLFLLPALLSSAFLGLAVSAVANNQSQAMMSLAIYFLALTLLSGFLEPIGEGSNLIRGLSRLFPLTFVHPVLNAWMFGAHPIPYLPEAMKWLALQSVLYGVLAGLAFRHALYRI